MVAVVAVVWAAATPAFAHVAVDATDASKGAEATTLTFRVPNEQDAAATTKVEVFLPETAAFEFVSVKPMPGWTITSDKTKVTWADGKLAPGQFDEFKIEVGPLPKAASLVFKAVQTYDNGDVVRWIDATPPSGDEPEHPAPVLTLTAAGDDDHHASSADSSDASSSTDKAALAVAVVATVLSIAALIVARNKARGTTS
jgi:uncharacterized protein YcnI